MLFYDPSSEEFSELINQKEEYALFLYKPGDDISCLTSQTPFLSPDFQDVIDYLQDLYRVKKGGSQDTSEYTVVIRKVQYYTNS